MKNNDVLSYCTGRLVVMGKHIALRDMELEESRKQEVASVSLCFGPMSRSIAFNEISSRVAFPKFRKY